MAKSRTLLSQLTSAPLARPCDEPWNEMHGDDRVRHCAACARDVYDLSAMTAREAEIRLLNAGVATPCIRYLRDRDGSIVHRAEPRALLSPSRSLAAAAALGVTISASAFAEESAKKGPPPSAPPQCVAYQQAPMNATAGTAALAEAPAEPKGPPEPRPLAGEPPMVNEAPVFGTLVVKSKIARQITLVGIQLTAPLPAYLLSPGEFIVEVREPSGKSRQVKLKITKNKTTTLDLDKK